MTLTFSQIVGVSCLALALYAKSQARPTPVVVDPSPPAVIVPADVAAAVAPVRSIVAQMSAGDRATWSAFCAACARGIAMSDSPIKNVAQVREMVVAGGALLSEGVAFGPPGLGAASSAFLKSQLGDDPVALDAAKRQQAVVAFTAMAGG